MIERIDRRCFLGAAGAALGVGTWPVSLHAVPSGVPVGQTAAFVTWSGDWAIDDMWSPLPRATARLGLGRRAGIGRVEMAALDHQFGV